MNTNLQDINVPMGARGQFKIARAEVDRRREKIPTLIFQVRQEKSLFEIYYYFVKITNS